MKIVRWKKEVKLNSNSVLPRPAANRPIFSTPSGIISRTCVPVRRGLFFTTTAGLTFSRGRSPTPPLRTEPWTRSACTGTREAVERLVRQTPHSHTTHAPSILTFRLAFAKTGCARWVRSWYAHVECSLTLSSGTTGAFISSKGCDLWCFS